MCPFIVLQMKAQTEGRLRILTVVSYTLNSDEFTHSSYLILKMALLLSDDLSLNPFPG